MTRLINKWQTNSDQVHNMTGRGRAAPDDDGRLVNEWLCVTGQRLSIKYVERPVKVLSD